MPEQQPLGFSVPGAQRILNPQAPFSPEDMGITSDTPVLQGAAGRPGLTTNAALRIFNTLFPKNVPLQTLVDKGLLKAGSMSATKPGELLWEVTDPGMQALGRNLYQTSQKIFGSKGYTGINIKKMAEQLRNSHQTAKKIVESNLVE